MSDFPLPGCLFKHMLTGQSSASSVSLQCLCWVIGWDVSDVVDEGGIGKEWERCFDRLSYDNTSEKGFSFVGWKSPSPIPETSKVGQAGQGWQESTSIAAAVPVCLCVCVSLYPACCLLTLYWGEYVPLHTHTHTHRGMTQQKIREKGEEGTAARSLHNFPVTAEFIHREDYCYKTTQFEVLRFRCSLFSKETPRWCQAATQFP